MLTVPFSLKHHCDCPLPWRAASVDSWQNEGRIFGLQMLLLPPQQDKSSNSTVTTELVKIGVCCLMHVHLCQWAESCQLDSPDLLRILCNTPSAAVFVTLCRCDFWPSVTSLSTWLLTSSFCFSALIKWCVLLHWWVKFLVWKFNLSWTVLVLALYSRWTHSHHFISTEAIAVGICHPRVSAGSLGLMQHEQIHKGDPANGPVRKK